MLLMANIILLAHAAVPHHHHDKVAVAIVHLWENETGHHHHEHDSDGHHHDSPESCFLPGRLSSLKPHPPSTPCNICVTRFGKDLITQVFTLLLSKAVPASVRLLFAEF